MRHALLLLPLIALSPAAIAQTDASAESLVLSRSVVVQGPDACRAQAAAFLRQIPEAVRIPLPPLPFEHAQEGPAGTLVLLCRQDGTAWRFLGAWQGR